MLDVRARHERRRQLEPQAARQVRADQHQRRDVLARHVAGGSRTVPPRRRPLHGDRQVPQPAGGRRPSTPSCTSASCSGRDRPAPQRRVRRRSVTGAGAERGERGDEPRRRAGQRGVQRRRRRARRPPPPVTDTRSPSSVDASTPERPQAADHRHGVVAVGHVRRAGSSPSASAAHTSARLAIALRPGHGRPRRRAARRSAARGGRRRSWRTASPERRDGRA